MNLNINPKVISSALGAGITAGIASGIIALQAHCGSVQTLASACLTAVLAGAGAGVLGYLKSQGSWTP